MVLGPLNSTFCTSCSAAAPASSFSVMPPSSPGPSRITAQSCLPIFSRTSLHQCPPSPLVCQHLSYQPETSLSWSHSSSTSRSEEPRASPTRIPSTPYTRALQSRLSLARRCSEDHQCLPVSDTAARLPLSPCRPCPAAAPAPSPQQAPYLLNLSALVTSSPCPQSSAPRPRPLSRAPPTSLFPRSDWSLPAAPGASLTLGTLTTNVLQERKPSFPDLTPCDLRPRFLKGSGARQVREGRGHHSPGGFFNRLPFCKNRPSGTRHRPAWTCTKSGTGASGSSPTLHKQLGRWTFLRSPCDFFFF